MGVFAQKLSTIKKEIYNYPAALQALPVTDSHIFLLFIPYINILLARV
jgi:hypothetical protein